MTSTRFAPAIPLVEAKLRSPSLRPGLVPRRRLLRLLAAEPAAPVIAIICPPGYGKTTLLAQWARSAGRPVAWLTVDALDNDPAVLLTYLAAAIDRLQPLDAAVGAALGALPERLIATAVPRLAVALHELDAPALLILDDIHRLGDRTALDAVATLLDHLPPRVRVALAGRTEPGLPLARLRASGKLLEMTPELLALDRTETRTLAAAAGWELDDEGAAAVLARTEGWAAGVYLAAHARALGIAPGGSPSSGLERPIAEYLRSEIQGSLADRDVDLLTRTAILERVEPAIAEAVAEVPGAADRLARLAREQRLIQDLGGPGPSYRYHQLLREFLLGEIERREPGATPVLHLRAATAYRAAGSLSAAVEHALASGNVDVAAALVADAGLPTFYAGHPATLERWLAQFDDRGLERHPSLAILAGWIHLLRGRTAETEHMAAIVERAQLEDPSGDGTSSLASGRAMLRAVMGRGGPEGVLAEARLAVAAEQPGSLWRANALWLLGSAHRLLGETVAADDAYADAVESGARAGATTMVALAARSRLALAGGDQAAAEQFIEAGLAVLEQANFSEIVAALPVHATASRIAAQRGDLRRARGALVRAQLVRPFASTAAPWFSVDALLEVARAYLAISDPAGARIAVREAEHIVRRRPDVGVLIGELDEVRARLDHASSTLAGSSTLTPAELRLLPLLPTYLTFEEIGDRLSVTRNTVKTQAMSIYGKLQASSRGEAVERAVELGLLEPFPGLAPARLRPEG